MMGTASALVPAIGIADQVIGRVRRRDVDRVTPCAPWTVGAVVDHLAGSLRLTAAAIARRDLDEATWANLIGSDQRPIDSFRHAVDELVGAVTGVGPGWATCPLPGGLRPAGFALDVAALEAVVHAWDVATSIGVRADVDPALAERLLVVAEIERHLAYRQAFAPPVTIDSGASPFERLLAFTGRSADAGCHVARRHP